MARLPANQKLVPSILDRLIGPDYEESSWSEEYYIDNELKAVRRDLEDLLNSHPPVLELEGGSDLLKRSLLTYGLPDLASLSIVAAETKSSIEKVLEGIIERYEPRLKEVRVLPVKTPADLERRLRYHINARLRVEPAPEVSFVTVFELATGQAIVTPSGT
jgi:type VI secretion system protein ImpF